MKKSAIVFAAIMAVIVLISCEQNNDIKGNVPLEAAKTSAIKKAEPVSFTFKTNLSADKVEWTVSPNRNVQIFRNGYQAKILFGEAGKYLVSATDQITVARTAVTVDSSTYVAGDTSTHVPVIPQVPVKPVPPADTVTPKPPVDTVGTHDVFLSLAGDEFTITPFVIDSLSGTGIGLTIVSTRAYQCLNSYIYFRREYSANESRNFKLSMSHVVQPGARFCQTGTKKLTVDTFIYPLSEGKQNLEIELDGSVYKGFIVRNGNSYSINWPYTTGIKFSTLTLTK
ncbi:hypothetical protein [Dyadobacter psychrotolerans]|uniref:Uncharacterized protein n=1 Tax=Dyadobacter psychrotolerans TaxID=2541721 RepID=A0A4V2Z4Y1_9BACT|nr:hypothetical protein [Dyadobacter psychrotolerans]TDE18488.1 hypothetical protein E0F88_02830 [Dyadobacter psychrotolerans]